MSVVSVDCLFAVNFSINFITLRLLCVLLKKDGQGKAKMIISAALIGIIECLSVVFHDLFNVCFTQITAFFTIAALFWDALLALLYCACSICISTLMSLTMKFFKDILPMKEVLVIPTVDMKRIIAAATVLIALTIAKVYLDQKQRRSTGASLEISYSGKAVRFSALRDSGNMLRDPLSGRYVAILSSKAADKLGVCEGSIINDTLKMRVIPIKSVGHRGILYAFVPDFAKVDGKKCEIVVALDKKNASFSGFEAIIPANL